MIIRAHCLISLVSFCSGKYMYLIPTRPSRVGFIKKNRLNDYIFFVLIFTWKAIITQWDYDNHKRQKYCMILSEITPNFLLFHVIMGLLTVQGKVGLFGSRKHWFNNSKYSRYEDKPAN